jgi:hypothetical protein
MTKATTMATGQVRRAISARTCTAEPGDVSWGQLQKLYDQSPDAAIERWDSMVQAAREELRSGNRAFGAIEHGSCKPVDRARFIALREELVDGWRPRNGIERSLVDTLALCQSALLFWLEILTEHTTQEPHLQSNEKWTPPRVLGHEAIDQAAAMADRFHRMAMRSIRQLRDLRRYVPTIVVQNAGAINVAEQQMNVTAK